MIDFTAQIYFKYIKNNCEKCSTYPYKRYIGFVACNRNYSSCYMNNKYHLQTAYSPITLPVNPPAVAVER